MQKKPKILTLLLLFFVITMLKPCEAKAEEEIIYGMVNFTTDMSNVHGGADVIITITNTTMNMDSVICLEAESGNKATIPLRLGTYTLKSSKVTSVDGVYELDFKAVMDDFTIDYTNPSFIWDITVDVKTDVEKIMERLEASESENGKEEKEETTLREEEVFRVESTNAYFPNQTIAEIQAWYTKEVKNFIATGKTNKTLHYFQDGVAYWADIISNGYSSKATLELAYEVKVTNYNTEDTQDFYQVQKKIYNFLLDYYKETGLYLNFEEWEESEDDSPAQTFTPPTDEETFVSTDEPSASEKEENTEVTEPVKDLELDIEEKEEKQSFGERLLGLVKDLWLTLFILVGAVGIFFILKNKKPK